MGWTKRWRKRLRVLFCREAVERELDEELAYHLEMETERNLRAGMSSGEARRQAAIAFGGVEKHKEEVRDARRFGWVPRMSLDFKLGLRMFHRYPGLTLVGGLSMAFAIAVGTAVFGYATRLVFPSLPFDGSERLVALLHIDQTDASTKLPHLSDFVAWRERLTTVDEVGAYALSFRNLETESGAIPVSMAQVSASAFRLWGRPPLLGRPLLDDDEHLAGPPVATIGEDVWESRFGRDPGVVGRTVSLGGSPVTIVGVMPAEFWFPNGARVWVPLRFDPSAYRPGAGQAVGVFGRLTPGASLESVQAELATVGIGMAADHPETHAHLRPQAIPLARAFVPLPPEVLVGAVSFAMLGIAFVLLVCGNVGLLMFARTAARESEITVRTALGASRARIVGQLFAEALVLATVSAIVGVSAASYGMTWLANAAIRLLSPDVLQFAEIPLRVEPYAAFHGAFLALLAAVVAGVIPALRLTGRRVESSLRKDSGGSRALRLAWGWTTVIVIQIALTMAFPALGYLVQRDVVRAEAADPGFASEEYLMATLHMDSGDLATSTIASAEEFSVRVGARYEDFKQRLESEPGVAGVTFAAQLPKRSHPWIWVEIDDGAAPSDGSLSEHRMRMGSVDPDYFSVLGAEIVAGRGFQPADLAPDQNVVVVNTLFVDRVMGGRNPVGRQLRYRRLSRPGTSGGANSSDTPEAAWYEIVGVVETLSMSDGAGGDAGVYEAIRPDAVYPIPMAIRVLGDPRAFAPQLRTLAAEIDPALQITGIVPFDEFQDLDLRIGTLGSRLAFGIGAIALILSLSGIYSIMALAVSQRTREIGIRIALGAEPRRIFVAIFRRPLGQIGIGIILGACFLAALLAGYFEGVPPGGPVATFASYVILMTAVCLLACVVPIRRAMGIEATEAMRADV
jgi:putative ABC transport system permease protein